MIKPPKFIETKDKKTFEIEGYSMGKFLIKSDGTFLIYEIDEGRFYHLLNGTKVDSKMIPRDANAHKFWMKRYEKIMEDIELMSEKRRLTRPRRWDKVR